MYFPDVSFFSNNRQQFDLYFLCAQIYIASLFNRFQQLMQLSQNHIPGIFEILNSNAFRIGAVCHGATSGLPTISGNVELVCSQKLVKSKKVGNQLGNQIKALWIKIQLQTIVYLKSTTQELSKLGRYMFVAQVVQPQQGKIKSLVAEKCFNFNKGGHFFLGKMRPLFRLFHIFSCRLDLHICLLRPNH